MSLTLLIAAAAAGACVTFFATRRIRGEGPEEEDIPPAGAAAGSGGGAGVETPPGLPLGVGDVVLVGSDEAWLAGALVLREGARVVAALFFAPEGRACRTIAAFAEPRRDVYWLEPAALALPREPPSTLEHGGEVLERRGRVPVRVARLGQGAPEVGDTALFATYEGASGAALALLVGHSGEDRSWAGRRLDPHEYDRLGKGGD